MLTLFASQRRAITTSFISLFVVAQFATAKICDPVKIDECPGMNEKDHPIIVVGGGLAGLTAAVQAAQTGSYVVLIDKEKNLGGNSAKATSGINACETAAQELKGIKDSQQLYKQDIFASGDGLSLPELVEKFVSFSKQSYEWLSTFNLSLTQVTQLGGHSVPRTHKIPPRPDGKPVGVGFTIVSALRTAAQSSELISILTQSKADSLIEENGRVVGLRYTNYATVPPTQKEVYGSSVILATGGFAANRAMIRQLQPSLATLATTNGPWAQGEGIALGTAIGAQLYGMDKIQVHPTAFVNPDAPSEDTKFLGPEALRGSGGILLNSKGLRFANELSRRDHLTAAIREQNDLYPGGPTDMLVAWIVMNQQALDDFGPANLAFYMSKGLIKTAANAQELAKMIGCEEEYIARTFLEYTDAAEKGADAFGKTVFPVTFSTDEKLYVAVVTPAIHYTMGGLKINSSGQVLRDGRPIEGLYAAGEVSGGLHGENRLAGNSLAECLIFGRIAAQHASSRRMIWLKVREEL